MKHLNNEKGVAMVVELVLVVAVLAVVGLAVYSSVQSKPKKTASATPTPGASATPSATPDPTAGWKTYTYAKGSVSFKYPADWKITADTDDNVATPKSHFVQLSSPTKQKGGFGESSFKLGLYYRESTTYTDPSKYKALGVDQITINGHNAYLMADGALVAGQVSQLILTDTAVTVGQETGIHGFIATPKAQIAMTGSYGEQAVTVTAPVNQWNAYPEVQTAKQIMATLKY